MIKNKTNSFIIFCTLVTVGLAVGLIGCSTNNEKLFTASDGSNVITDLFTGEFGTTKGISGIEPQGSGLGDASFELDTPPNIDVQDKNIIAKITTINFQ